MQFLIALDQLLNTLIGGYADEMLSARAHRLQHTSRAWARARRVINALFFWQPDHCKAAHKTEYDRRQLPAEYRR